MRWLMERVRAAWLAIKTPTPRQARVGLLNTGELVLIDGMGQPMVFSTDTTELMRDALQHDFNETFIDLRGPMGTSD
ncbi:hypothetical protein ACG04Q_11940 [Roseateles sp. DXS20W]|uniref:Uncharacterized protein n=1 Tax=Pelomonas lactea TaxID=3299030 RepID=A0ABW7GJZ7_9BURK